MKPDLDAVAAGFDDVDLVVLDAAAAPSNVAGLGVFGTPTLIAVRGGTEVARLTGRRTRSELGELFSQLASGDPVVVPRVGRGDRVVWTIGGLGLAVAAVFLGPSWPLIAVGVGLVTYANLSVNRIGGTR